MIFSLVYYLICAGIIFGSDDGKPWKFSDYILLLFAGIYAPLSVGVYIGKHLREHKVYKAVSYTHLDVYKRQR